MSDARQSGAPAAARAPFRHLRWYVILLFFGATIVSYIDRQALSVNAPHVRAELHLSATDYSWLVTAFLVAYTLGPVVVGRALDTIGVRLGMTLAVLWWSVAAAGHSAASSVAAFVALRFCLGLGEAATLPSTIKTIAEWFPIGERSLATSIFSAGTAIGAVIAVPVVALATAWVGWRASFLITGLLGFLWLVPWWLLYDRPERHPRLSPDERRLILEGRGQATSRTLSPFALLRMRKPWGIVLGRFMVDPVWQFYLFWLPSYLVEQRGFTLRTLGLVGWLPFLATDAGSLLGGWLGKRILERTGDLTRARRVVLAAGAVGTLCGLPAAFVGDAWLSMALLCGAAFSIGLWAPTVLTMCADIMPRGTVGTMTGVSSLGAGVGGILLTPAIGWIVDRYSYPPVFVLTALLPPIGFVLLTTLVGKVEEVDTSDA